MKNGLSSPFLSLLSDSDIFSSFLFPSLEFSSLWSLFSFSQLDLEPRLEWDRYNLNDKLHSAASEGKMETVKMLLAEPRIDPAANSSSALR